MDIAAALAVVALLWVLRVAALYRSRRSHAKPVRTLAVLGSGGHTAEMIQLLQAMDRAKFGPMLYVIAQTDTTSADRIKAFEQSVADRQPPPAAAAAAPAYRLLIVPRSREVGQSYATSALTTLHALAYSVWHVFVALPSLVLCNGPGTCVPICAAALLVRLLGTHGQQRDLEEARVAPGRAGRKIYPTKVGITRMHRDAPGPDP